MAEQRQGTLVWIRARRWRKSPARIPTELKLRHARDRQHVLEAVLAAVDDWQRVGEILKSAPDETAALLALRAEYEMSEVQATAVMDMQWRRLTTAASARLQRELAEIQAFIGTYETGE